MLTLPAELAHYTDQEIQLALMRRSSGDWYDGEETVTFLLEHQALWTAVMRDQFYVNSDESELSLNPPRLFKLRTLPKNWWSVDTLYVLCADEERLERLIALGIERELWSEETIERYTQVQTQAALIDCKPPDSYRIFAIWSD